MTRPTHEKYRLQGIAEEASRVVKCAASAKIKEMLAEKNLELPSEVLERLLNTISTATFLELWKGLCQSSASKE